MLSPAMLFGIFKKSFAEPAEKFFTKRIVQQGN
jgi:hypothetical protein